MALEGKPRFTDHEVMRLICEQFNLEVPDFLIGQLAIVIRQRCGHSILPQPGETLAISVMRPKTAALAFDRVFRIPDVSDPVPESIAFFGGSPAEFALCALPLISWIAREAGTRDEKPNVTPAEAVVNARHNLTLLASERQSTFGVEPTIFYANSAAQEVDYPPGPQEVLTTAISNLELVDEKSLSWEQVIEFRKDRETRRKYRRLIRWLDAELQTKALAEILATIEERLDDYQWALRKHGINTVLGAMSCLLDPKFLAGLSAAVAGAGLAGGSGWAALAGASVTVGRSVVSVGTAYISGLDERRKGEREIAYLYDLQRRL